MDNKEQKRNKKKDTGSIRIAFSSMVLFILFLAEIYLMIHESKYFIALVTVTVLLLAVLYILVISIMQVNYQKEQRMLDEFNDLFRSEKAVYLLLRNNFGEIIDRLTNVEDNMKTPTEEIIDAQKAIAKVSISRNKENTDALMNSNDKLLERFFSFEDLLASNNDKILEQQKIIIEQANKEIIMTQQESMAKLKELELSIKNEILQSVNTITSIQSKVVVAGQSQVQPEKNSPVEEVSSMEEILESETDLGIMDESIESEEVSSLDELLAEEALVDVEPDKTEEFVDELSEPESVSESISELDPFEGLTESESISEPELFEGLTESESISEPDPFEGLTDLESIAEEDLIEELAESESFEELSPFESEISIGDAVAEDDLTESEQIVEEPLEEVPPMPDMSDPNKMMTPEDIAALLANM